MHSCHSNPKVKRWGCLTLIPLLLYMVVLIIVRTRVTVGLPLEGSYTVVLQLYAVLAFQAHTVVSCNV
jgi:hypothetical protein